MASTLDGLLAAKEIAVVCGPGGVGKTTVAAAAALMAACHHGGKVLVVTVDPARRLATALGLADHGGAVQKVPDELFAQSGVRPRGELWAAMLDAKRSWDDLVNRHAPDAATAKRILENPLYQDISGRFVQSHDYIAVERLYELHSEGSYDLIVVDTPPTRNAIDFLLAPERMADFFSSRLLKTLTVPYRSRLADVASRPFYYVADRILGSQFIQDIAEFFILFQTLSEGFVARAKKVEALLSDRRTTFVVVSTLETVPAREADTFMNLLPSKDLHLGALVLNRVLPDFLLAPGLAERARQLGERSAQLAGELSSSGTVPDDAVLVERALNEVATNFYNLGIVARREASQKAELSKAPAVIATAPELDEDVHDVASALALGRYIWS